MSGMYESTTVNTQANAAESEIKNARMRPTGELEFHVEFRVCYDVAEEYRWDELLILRPDGTFETTAFSEFTVGEPSGSYVCGKNGYVALKQGSTETPLDLGQPKQHFLRLAHWQDKLWLTTQKTLWVADPVLETCEEVTELSLFLTDVFDKMEKEFNAYEHFPILLAHNEKRLVVARKSRFAIFNSKKWSYFDLYP